MKYRQLHDWNLSVSEAISIQEALRSQVKIQPLAAPIKLVAGADISFDKSSDKLFAAFVVLALDTLQIVDSSSIVSQATFPYVPGLLSFRELPPLLKAWAALKTPPDVVFIDGQGIAHPRRFGIASHFGVLTGVPCIGCAKTLLVGNVRSLASNVGATAPIIHQKEKVGVALRTKKNVQPVYISVGHMIELEEAIKLTMRCLAGYRIPEPTRQAHLLVNKLRKDFPNLHSEGQESTT
ncbi:MAG: deoxyribonuclease V [Acidobacteriota bacterium]|nr:deoxyribonuclease V [Blastocatellia bacterium]MDW8413423.1 deoxyribonuclease V [Acidobacteriota bacterium]